MMFNTGFNRHPSHGESLLRSGTCTGLIQLLQSKYTITLQVWIMPPENWYSYLSYTIIIIKLHINPYYPSRPGKHPSSEPNSASARLDSRLRKKPTIRTEPHTFAVTFSPGGYTHQPNRAAQQCGWSLPNSLPMLWETLYTTY